LSCEFYLISCYNDNHFNNACQGHEIKLQLMRIQDIISSMGLLRWKRICATAVLVMMCMAMVQHDVERMGMALVGEQRVVANAAMNELPAALDLLASARNGQCHPAIVAQVETAWRASNQVIPLDALQRMVWMESRCLPWKVGTHGERGLMQVRSAAAMAVGYDPDALGDIEVNLAAGIEYLELMGAQAGGDMAAALTMYNMGPTRYARQPRITDYARVILH
jgi:hypothetical protein